MPIAEIITYCSVFSVLIPIFFLLRKKQNFKNPIIKILGTLLFVSAFSDLASLILFKLGGKSSMPIINPFFITQFVLLSCVYYRLLKNKKIIYIAVIIFLLFSVFNIVFIQPFTEFQSWPVTLGSIILMCYSILYFLQLLDFPPTLNLFRHFSFWFNMAVFYYFGASFLVFISINYVLQTQSVEFSKMVWGFHNVNNIIKNILFAIAIYFAGVKQKENEKIKPFVP
jgi:hypothetical protein